MRWLPWEKARSSRSSTAHFDTVSSSLDLAPLMVWPCASVSSSSSSRSPSSCFRIRINSLSIPILFLIAVFSVSLWALERRVQ